MKFTDRDGFTDEIPCPCDPPCDWEAHNLCCVCKGSPTVNVHSNNDSIVVCKKCEAAFRMGMLLGENEAFGQIANVFVERSEQAIIDFDKFWGRFQ